MNTAAYEIVDSDGEARLRLTGDWTTTALGRLPTELSRDLEGRDIASIDTSDLGRFDTAGALALVQASSGRLSKSQWKDRPEAGRIYHMIELLERQSAPAPKRPSAFVRTFAKIGRGVYDFGGEAMLSLAFLGRLMAAVVEAAKHPGGIRWPAWVSQAERELILLWGKWLGWDAAEVAALDPGATRRKEAPAGRGGAYEQAMQLLGVRPDTDPQLIKRAYRRLLSKHHPDKQAGAGANAAQVRDATERTRELHSAYALIRERRGFR